MDYQLKSYSEDIIAYSSLGDYDTIPLPHLFRTYREMPKLEQQALKICRGTVLDIGCGAGSHSLYLQEKDFAVTALDNSLGAIKACGLRGVKKFIHSSIYDLHGMKFDTLLLLMNGIGLARTLNNLDQFLGHLRSLLHPNGQILLDSSDIRYMYDTDEQGNVLQVNTEYYGEVEFILAYKGLRSAPFSWLYLDYKTLQQEARRNGLKCQCVSDGKHFDYLARLTLS